jgi:hypothetical protein
LTRVSEWFSDFSFGVRLSMTIYLVITHSPKWHGCGWVITSYLCMIAQSRSEVKSQRE